MKKIILTSALMLTLFSAVFAGTENLYKFSGARNFFNQFPTATNVTAKTVGEYTKFSFVYNEKKTDAFYNENGELIATSHIVELKLVPAVAVAEIAEKYPNANIIEVIEFNNLVETTSSFYIALVERGRKTILEVSPNGNVSLFK